MIACLPVAFQEDIRLRVSNAYRVVFCQPCSETRPSLASSPSRLASLLFPVRPFALCMFASTAIDMWMLPGSEHAFESLAHAREYIEGKDGIGYPVMCKAAFGGGLQTFSCCVFFTTVSGCQLSHLLASHLACCLFSFF